MVYIGLESIFMFHNPTPEVTMETKLRENELETDRVRKLNAIIADLLARIAALELAAG